MSQEISIVEVSKEARSEIVAEFEALGKMLGELGDDYRNLSQVIPQLVGDYASEHVFDRMAAGILSHAIEKAGGVTSKLGALNMAAHKLRESRMVLSAKLDEFPSDAKSA